jgi:Rieske Fe-S protein
MTALVVAALAPLLVFIWPSGGKVKNADVSVNLSKPPDQLQDGEVLQFNAPAQYGFKMIDGGGDNYPGKVTFGAYAIKTGGKVVYLSLTCSHLGCSVSWTPSSHQFDCPCHGSIFDMVGNVVHGPAIAPLSHLQVMPGSKPTEIKVQGYALQGVG